jgi:hypothetical protein
VQSCAISSLPGWKRESCSGIGRVSPVNTKLPGSAMPNAVSGAWCRTGNTWKLRPWCQNERATGTSWNASQKLPPPSATTSG